MYARHLYRIAGKLSLAVFLLSGAFALTLPVIRKKIHTHRRTSKLRQPKEHDIVINPPLTEEVSIIQARRHPGI